MFESIKTVTHIQITTGEWDDRSKWYKARHFIALSQIEEIEEVTDDGRALIRLIGGRKLLALEKYDDIVELLGSSDE